MCYQPTWPTQTKLLKVSANITALMQINVILQSAWCGVQQHITECIICTVKRVLRDHCHERPPVLKGGFPFHNICYIILYTGTYMQAMFIQAWTCGIYGLWRQIQLCWSVRPSAKNVWSFIRAAQSDWSFHQYAAESHMLKNVSHISSVTRSM